MPTRDKVCGSRSAGQHGLGSAVAAQVALGGRRCLEPGAAASLSARPRPPALPLGPGSANHPSCRAPGGGRDLRYFVHLTGSLCSPTVETYRAG